MNASLAAPKKVWTEAELQALPEDGFIHELVEGEIVISPKNDSSHGYISTGFRMNNLNIRAPDISFISYTRLNALGFDVSSRGFIPGAPDLAVEVLSLDNTRKDINDRLKDFLNSGTRLACIIDPKAKLAEVCHSPTERRRVVRADILDGADVLPGFRYPVGDLFLVWQWA